MISDAEITSRRGWFDAWLEPAWHALVTWVALAGIMGAMLDAGLADHLQNAVDFLMSKVAPTLPGWLAPIRGLMEVSNFVPLVVWYQPLLLRLGLLRWLIWMGGAISMLIVLEFGGPGLNRWDAAFAFWVWPSVAGVLLINRRSKPWMSLPAGLLSLVLGRVLLHAPQDGNWGSRIEWWWIPASNLPYALVMLYGTQRLRPREEAAPEL